MSIIEKGRLFFNSPEEEQLYYKDKDRMANLPSSRPLANGKEGRKIEPIRLAEIPEPGPRVDLVEGIIPQNHLSILYGDGGQGKSYLALALGTAVTTGQSFIDLQCQKHPVLYLDWELDCEEHARRSYAIARGMNLAKPPVGLFYLRAEDNCLEIIDAAKDFVSQEGIGLVIVDSFGGACGGDPDTKTIVPFLSALRALKTTILILDHQAKMQEGQNFRNKTPYGSAYKFNFARSVLHSHKVAGNLGELSLLLRHTKCNFGVLKDEQALRLIFGEGMVRIEKGDMASDSSFIECLPTDKRIEQSLKEDGPATAKTLAEKLGISAKTVANIASKLKKEGKIEETGKEGHAPIYGIPNFPTSRTYSGKEDGKKAEEMFDPSEWAQDQLSQRK